MQERQRIRTNHLQLALCECALRKRFRGVAQCEENRRIEPACMAIGSHWQTISPNLALHHAQPDLPPWDLPGDYWRKE